jgi:hypothetical protein
VLIRKKDKKVSLWKVSGQAGVNKIIKKIRDVIMGGAAGAVAALNGV